jgi:hypothetical protein
LAGSDVNHENADPDRDEEKNRILSASTFTASPHWMMNRVMCYIVDVSSCLENLVKYGTWYLIITRRIRCPVHAGLLLGFYPILLQ